MNKLSGYMVSTIVLILLFSVSSKVTAQIHPETLAKLRIELIPKIARSEIVGRGDGPITTLPVIEKSEVFQQNYLGCIFPVREMLGPLTVEFSLFIPSQRIIANKWCF
jgi:hypothetical protein